MQAAVAAEQYDVAKLLKAGLAELQSLAEQTDIAEEAKEGCVSREDYDGRWPQALYSEACSEACHPNTLTTPCASLLPLFPPRLLPTSLTVILPALMMTGLPLWVLDRCPTSEDPHRDLGKVGVTASCTPMRCAAFNMVMRSAATIPWRRFRAGKSFLQVGRARSLLEQLRRRDEWAPVPPDSTPLREHEAAALLLPAPMGHLVRPADVDPRVDPRRPGSAAGLAVLNKVAEPLPAAVAYERRSLVELFGLYTVQCLCSADPELQLHGIQQVDRALR